MIDEREQADPAAILGAALSLWHACKQRTTTNERIKLSECYQGGDEFMRVMMRVATRFERWSCLHITFEKLDDVWPYVLEDRFGAACVGVMGAENLAHFDDDDCLRVALHLRLPVKLSPGLPVPVNVSAANPVPDSPFVYFRIQTVRDRYEDSSVEPFTLADDPFDEECGPPYLALYGVESDGSLEHIADRQSYADAAQLARRLAPGIVLPS